MTDRTGKPCSHSFLLFLLSLHLLGHKVKPVQLQIKWTLSWTLRAQPPMCQVHETEFGSMLRLKADMLRTTHTVSVWMRTSSETVHFNSWSCRWWQFGVRSVKTLPLEEAKTGLCADRWLMWFNRGSALCLHLYSFMSLTWGSFSVCRPHKFWLEVHRRTSLIQSRAAGDDEDDDGGCFNNSQCLSGAARHFFSHMNY